MNKFLSLLILVCLAGIMTMTDSKAEDDSLRVTKEMIAETEKLIGLEFTDEERELMLGDVDENLAGYESLREIQLDNSVAPALLFNPIPPGYPLDPEDCFDPSFTKYAIRAPKEDKFLAFHSVAVLGTLMKERRISSVQLTRLFLDRLKKHDSQLHCVITLTEELAMEQARRADEEIAAGKYRGPLHGIPYGAKDLLAKSGYPTTWGATTHKDQVLEYDATVIKKLEEAGAILVAKLTMGALAWGDVWYGDTTRNPWNLEQGSSGSSAGSASSVAAGLVPFAIGTETWGSIVSPATRCGATGLRPTFGRVSRHGAMALSWSMDKIGPICRTVEDCAIVFDAIRGADQNDPTTINHCFNYSPWVDLSQMKIGYLKEDFELDSARQTQNEAVFAKMRELGAELIEIRLPDIDVSALPIILRTEAAAAFDEITRSNRDDLLVRQIRYSWPNVFRHSRLVPAVEYIQANRVRTLLVQAMDKLMKQIDVYIAPSLVGDNLLMNNLTGHPCVVLPHGFDENGSPTSITFVGRLFDEANLLGVAKAYQDGTEHHLKHPETFLP